MYGMCIHVERVYSQNKYLVGATVKRLQQYLETASESSSGRYIRALVGKWVYYKQLNQHTSLPKRHHPDPAKSTY